MFFNAGLTIFELLANYFDQNRNMFWESPKLKDSCFQAIESEAYDPMVTGQVVIYCDYEVKNI